MGLAGFSRAALATTLLVAGCGSGGEPYANKLRPAAPITVSAAVRDDGIALSPRSFGAGPVVLIVSNQSARPQTLTLETDEPGGSEPGLAPQSTGPVRPRGTATLKVDLRPGTYSLRARNPRSAVRIAVGPPRPSAQNDLMQP